MTQVAVAAALVVLAIVLSRAGGLGVERELAISAVRAACSSPRLARSSRSCSSTAASRPGSSR